MYILYNDGELLARFPTEEAVRDEIEALRSDYISDDLRDMEKYPSEYPEDYVAGANFNEYFADTYSICIELTLEAFL